MAVDSLEVDADEERLLKLYSPGSGEMGVATTNILKELGRHINCLEDNNRATRKRAIEGIRKDTTNVEPEVLDEVFR
jgi:hypothetical protein